MISLTKWIEKTAQAVRKICEGKKAPCVGFSLVFYDPFAEEEERWNYVIELAFDPQNPPDAEERERLQKCFEFISEGIKRIYGGTEEADRGPAIQVGPYRH